MAHDKRLNSAYTSFDRTKSYSLDEAIKLVRANAKAKFDETVEFSMNLGIDPRHADQMVRGLISLPNCNCSLACAVQPTLRAIANKASSLPAGSAARARALRARSRY